MTYDEYLTNIAIPFREYLANKGDVDEYPGGWVSVDCDVICHTETCPQKDVVKRMRMPEQFNGIYTGCCGYCFEGVDDTATPYVDITFWGYNGEQFTV